MGERVPWSVMTYYDGGRLGHAGCCSSSATPEAALLDAKQWARDHPGNWSLNWFKKPTVTITIDNRNWITGERK